MVKAPNPPVPNCHFHCSVSFVITDDDRPCRYNKGSTSVIFGVASPCGQDRRGEPLPFAGVGVDALVVDPRARSRPPPRHW
jgi:hypothetical protein